MKKYKQSFSTNKQSLNFSGKKYQPAKLEKKWQKRWKDKKIYSADLTKPDKKFYVLAEFPYPSGDLHMGHWFTFTGADIYARFKRMQGYNVFFPNGFDAFGLPAENAAIKRGIHPQDWTLKNVERMKEQFATTGGSFTFDNEVITCLPNYYHWNQWIFLRMLEKDLAYRGKYLSNWCENDQTVLANEGVVDGLCWRCGNPVVQKEVEQWFLKITDYADKLIWPEDPSTSLRVNWPKSVRDAQNDWIGKKDGINIKYQVDGIKHEIEVFTTRPDTNFGATFIALAPEHPFVAQLLNSKFKIQSSKLEEVRKYVDETAKESELDRKENREKTGVFTGLYATNPLTGYKMPIWVSDFVLFSFGTGALVGVPGSDIRDFEFANKFGLEIKRVVVGSDGDQSPITSIDQVQEQEGTMVNSDFLDGLEIHEAKNKIMDYMEQKAYGKRQVQYHIHDWSISRQRYWGTPIPVVHCPKCGIVPVPDSDLPIKLPYDVDFTPKGKPPLASNEEWLNVKCPNCGGDAKRDADTMDTFIDSSWYFFRYVSPDYEKGPFDTDLSKKIMPVDIYFGGAEHTLGHTLYSRFFTKFFKDIELTDLAEYALRRINHGIVLGPDGNKMSKSKGNVVNPDDEVKKYGSDAVRVHVAFFMPYDGVGPWISDRIWGPYHFLERVWELFDKVNSASPGPASRQPQSTSSLEAIAAGAHRGAPSAVTPRDEELSKKDLLEMNRAIQKISLDIENIKFNTAIASLMQWINYLSRKDKISQLEYKTFLLLLAPFAPHITEELWELSGFGSQLSDEGQSVISRSDTDKQKTGKPKSENRQQRTDNWSIHIQPWPKVSDKDLEEEQLPIIVQVNGRVRETIMIDTDILNDSDKIEEIAKKSPKIQKYLGDRAPKRTIYVPGKVLSFVI